MYMYSRRYVAGCLRQASLSFVRDLDTWLRLEVKMALVLALACWRWRGTDADMADTAGNR